MNEKYELVIIGASTGGPSALELIVPKISKEIILPIIVVQHLPATFTKTFAKRLGELCDKPVKEASDTDVIENGHVYICPGNSTVTVATTNNQPTFKIEQNLNDTLTPSITSVMLSALTVYKKVIGVILTGMGNDGYLGMKKIKQDGGGTIVQDEKSSIVYGMAKEIVDAGLADKIVSLNDIPNEIINTVKNTEFYG